MGDKKYNTKEITKGGIIAALYIVLTHVLSFMSFGVVQIRISEMLLILPFYNKKYTKYCLLAVIVANAFSPLGMVDVIAGVVCCLAYLIPMKNKIVAGLIYSIWCGVVIGTQLHLILSAPLIFSMLSVFAGQLISCVLIGVPILNTLEKRELI